VGVRSLHSGCMWHALRLVLIYLTAYGIHLYDTEAQLDNYCTFSSEPLS
jgi:hypothetical protein